MKETGINKINLIGRIGYIVTILIRVILGVALAGLVIAMIASFIFPDNLVEVKMNASADVCVNLPLDEENISDFEAGFRDGFFEDKFTVDIAENEIVLDDIEVNGAVVKMSGDGPLCDFKFGDLKGGIVLATLRILLSFVIMFFIGDLCKKFRNCTTPFEETVITSMNRFSIAMIVWAVVAFTIDALLSSAFGGIGADFNFNLTSVFIVVIVYALTIIFKYGAKLQQESDETL